jgi:hypothetical protein
VVQQIAGRAHASTEQRQSALDRLGAQLTAGTDLAVVKAEVMYAADVRSAPA